MVFLAAKNIETLTSDSLANAVYTKKTFKGLNKL